MSFSSKGGKLTFGGSNDHQNNKNIMTTKIRSPFKPTILSTKDEFIAPFTTLFDRIIDQHFPEIKADLGIQFTSGAYPKVDLRLLITPEERHEFRGAITGRKFGV